MPLSYSRPASRRDAARALAAPGALAAPAAVPAAAPGAASPLRLLELPTTHSLGMTARAALSPAAPPTLHCYFHDTDLVVPARAHALAVALAVLGRRRRPLDLDGLAAVAGPSAPELSFADLAPRAAASR